MDWNYFLNDGRFRAKRLPAIKGPVQAKDITDLEWLREQLRDDAGHSDPVETYTDTFDDPGEYDVFIESLLLAVSLNRRKYFSNEPGVSVAVALADPDNDDLKEWLPVEEPPADWLIDDDVVVVKSPLTSDDWNAYLTGRYTVAELKALAKNAGSRTQGSKKADIVQSVGDAILRGEIEHKPPALMRRGDAFDTWYRDIVDKYVKAVADGIASFEYPLNYQKAVIEASLDTNDDWTAVVDAIKKRFPDLLPAPPKAYERSADLAGGGISVSISLEGLTTKVSGLESVEKMDVDNDDGLPQSAPGTFITFRYRDSAGSPSERTVFVQKIVRSNDRLGFAGHCQLAEAWRNFLVSRVEGEMINRDTGEIMPAAALTSVDDFKTFLAMAKRKPPKASGKPGKRASQTTGTVSGTRIAKALLLIGLFLIVSFLLVTNS